MPNTEHGLLEKAREGDVASFEALIQPHQAKLLRVILAVTPCREDAEDCLQEALVKAYRALPSFRGEAAFTTWLYRVALNATRNWLRAEARHTSARFADSLEIAAAPSDATPERQVVANETASSIRAVLAALPDHYREPLVLRYYRNMSYDEIAAVLVVPIGTVRSRLAQARRLLSERLQSLGILPGPEEVQP